MGEIIMFGFYRETVELMPIKQFQLFYARLRSLL